ncbi:MAG: hypothetical protein ACODAC_03895 [Pseudomonadota bacterium]
MWDRGDRGNSMHAARGLAALFLVALDSVAGCRPHNSLWDRARPLEFFTASRLARVPLPPS